VTLEDALEAIDRVADRTFAGWKVPGLSYGVVRGGELIHSRGLGTLRVGEVALPDADSVFRIASMTKSFTAATVLLLRDEGRLNLDDPIGLYVPDLATLRGPTTDSPPILIRHLLTMTAGFPTDDPWGDRQQGLDLERFAELLRGGFSFAWAPGTHFEYSNLGYGILGRLITHVTGSEYRDVVRERLLLPLGMSSTTFEESEVPHECRARGYVCRDGAWVDEPSDPYGALAAMGGIFTSVRDLARWVGGFTDAFPPRDDPDDGHPLRRSSRREMQEPQRPWETELIFASADASPEFQGGAYGFGLTTAEHLRFGRIVQHSGGYPGFGSNMRWHPASGLATIVLANGRYAPAHLLGREMLHSLLEAKAVPARRIEPAAPTAAARASVERLLDRWDDGEAARLFAMNVELDEPIELRRAAAARLREVHGALRADPDEQPESRSPFHLAWWLRGARGRVRAEILLSPERDPRVQALTLTSVPDPAVELTAAADRIVTALAGLSPVWPADLVLGPDVDAAALGRSLAAAAARFGPIDRCVAIAVPISPDLPGSATFRLTGTRGSLDLRLARDPESGRWTTAALIPVPLEAPPLAD
jgi:CubicO group peptidase (beta-lactamase class C family)